MKNKELVTPITRIEIHTSAESLKNPVLNLNYCRKKKRPKKLRYGD